MLTIYFCLGDKSPVLRYWCSVPRIGDTVALPELGGNLDPVRVYDVIWEGFEDQSVSVYVHHTKVDHAVCHNSTSRPGLDFYLREHLPR
jgi:hypothetical protein